MLRGPDGAGAGRSSHPRAAETQVLSEQLLESYAARARADVAAAGEHPVVLVQRGGEGEMDGLGAGLRCPHGQPESGELLIRDAGTHQVLVELAKIEAGGGVGIGEVARFIEPDFDAFWIPGSSFHREDEEAGCVGASRGSRDANRPLWVALYRGTPSPVKRPRGLSTAR